MNNAEPVNKKPQSKHWEKIKEDKWIKSQLFNEREHKDNNFAWMMQLFV